MVPSPTTRRTTSPSETWSPGPPLVKGTPVATRRTSASLPNHGGKGLVTNYREGGGLQNGRRGGHVKFYPCEKGGGGAEKVSAMLKGGHKKCWCRFYTVA